ncbi:MAG: hypothetical protein AB7F23_07300, partial [Phycisphaerae bacterium]
RKQRHCASNAKSATVITFNFGVLARLRCVSPTNAGETKPKQRHCASNAKKSSRKHQPTSVNSNRHVGAWVHRARVCFFAL